MNSKELTEQIQKNTRVILPEFGAFLVKESSDKGFNPSNVSFSPFLRYNDGMLEVYVAKSKGISKEEAAKEVHEFVETIKNELQEKGTFQIESLGFLKRDQRGSLTFVLAESDPTKSQNGNKAKKTSEKEEKKDETINIPEIKVEEKKDFWEEDDKPIVEYDEPKKARKVGGSKAVVEKMTVTRIPLKIKPEDKTIDPEPSKEDKTEVIQKTKLSEEKKQETKDIEKPIVEKIEKLKPLKEEVAKEKISEIIQEPKQIEKEKVAKIEDKIIIETKKTEPTVFIDLSEPKRKDEIESKTTFDSSEKDNSKKNWLKYVYATITLLVIVGLFFIIRYYYLPPNIEALTESLESIKTPDNDQGDNINTQEKINNPKDDIERAFNESSSDNDVTNEEKVKTEIAQEENIEKTLIQNTQTERNTNIKFYIIVGSFRNSSFAQKFADDLKKSGHNPEIIMQPSGMNAVSIGTYNTRDEAAERSQKIKNDFPNSWILKK
ncbi:MAG: SPOR domain-containing protein [Tenuifilaceae bacterium]